VSRSAWLADLTFQTVIVHTKAGTSVKGLRAAVYEDCIVLRDAMVLEPEAQVLLDGEVTVPRENVDFMQIISATNGAA
jgi:hypothetical protein